MGNHLFVCLDGLLCLVLLWLFATNLIEQMLEGLSSEFHGLKEPEKNFNTCSIPFLKVLHPTLQRLVEGSRKIYTGQYTSLSLAHKHQHLLKIGSPIINAN